MVLQYRIVLLDVLKAPKCEFVLLFVAEYTYIHYCPVKVD